MPDGSRLHEMLELTALGGIGIALALLLLIAGRLFLPESQRPRLRIPLVLLVLHIIVVALGLFVLDEEPLRRGARVVALALLLVAMGRSAFLLIVHAIVGRRSQVPLPRIIQDILQAFIYVAVTLVVMRAAGVELTSILTTSALLTAVIGLSLQETLGNLFAGLAIQAQRPFELGDWIQFDNDSANIGRVVEINWRATRMLTIDNVEITVPNGALARASIRNYSKPTTDIRRSVTIVVAPDVPPGEVHRIFLEGLKNTPGVLEQPAPDAQTIGFNDRGVEYRVRFWTNSFDRREPLDGAVRDRLWYALQRAGYGVPAALRHVYMHEASERTRESALQRAAEARQESLRGVDIFRDLPKDALHAVAQGTDRRMYGAGEMVIREGSEGSELFVVESGEVEVLVSRDKGEPARVAVLGKGRFFGEMSLMTGERRRASVRTVTDTVLLVVDKSDFQPVLESNSALAQRISSLLAEREVGLGEAQSRDPGERKSMVEMRSDALLKRIRAFFSL